MPRPVFNIEEYELRGRVPEVYTKEQQEKLNKTLSRAQGQIDWTAQLLGFNGPNYWGQSNPKSDFSYNWVGLPETMNEKRQMQVGAYGVYNKNLDYDQWPSPFNRKEIKASGDARIHIFERGGITFLSPLGQGEETDYSYDQVMFAGASYVFDAQVEISNLDDDFNNEIFAVEYFFQAAALWTRVNILQPVESVKIRIVGSEAKVAVVNVLQWEDISDWTSEAVQNQFIGLWGNKGNTISMDFAFDALDLHGYQERFALELSGSVTCLSIERLLALAGLEPTEYTKFYNDKFQFFIGENCSVATPESPYDPQDNVDNGDMDAATPPVDLLDNGSLESGVTPTPPPVDNRTYERVFDEDGDFLIDNYEFFRCDDDCSYELILTQTLSEAEECPSDPCPDQPQYYRGIGEICFDYKPLIECAKVEYPCVEWVFDPSLDDGEYERQFSITDGPWATANEGEYDRPPVCTGLITQGSERCDSPLACAFDDGIFDEPVGVDDNGDPVSCTPDLEDGNVCDEADGGFYTLAGPPDYSDCECGVECCEIDNGIYALGLVYTGPEIADGGTLEETCILYSAGTYDPTITDYTCEIDDGDFDDPIAATLTVDERNYDRVLTGCEPCDDSAGADELTRCVVESYRVNVGKTIFDNFVFTMRPNIRNSLTPLRVWKNNVLTVTDTVPGEGTEYYNYLVADENRGPEPEDAYRYFVRLPLEYARNGKDWNRAIAVCNNQGYFSAPTDLAQTEANPPIIRPYLYSETYWRKDLEDYTIFYDEDFLVSEVRQDNGPVQDGFSDSAIVFEVEQPIPYAFAQITEYDPFFLRKPDEDGEWRGDYFGYGPTSVSNPKLRTGHVSTDLASQAIQSSPTVVAPIYDYSPAKIPDVEFPDSVDEAALKNYVVSYAYFAADFSASDEPVFDPQTLHCWRSPAVECSEEEGGNCVTSCKTTNTAYRLHEYETLTC